MEIAGQLVFEDKSDLFSVWVYVKEESLLNKKKLVFKVDFLVVTK
jgi:hypothetical protein